MTMPENDRCGSCGGIFGNHSQTCPRVDYLKQYGVPGKPAGATFVATVPPGAKVVGMVNFRDQIIVALDIGVYVLRDGKFEPIPFVEQS